MPALPLDTLLHKYKTNLGLDKLVLSIFRRLETLETNGEGQVVLETETHVRSEMIRNIDGTSIVPEGKQEEEGVEVEIDSKDIMINEKTESERASQGDFESLSASIPYNTNTNKEISGDNNVDTNAAPSHVISSMVGLTLPEVYNANERVDNRRDSVASNESSAILNESEGHHSIILPSNTLDNGVMYVKGNDADSEVESYPNSRDQMLQNGPIAE